MSHVKEREEEKETLRFQNKPMLRQTAEGRQFFYAEVTLNRDPMQKRPVILRILLIVATP